MGDYYGGYGNNGNSSGNYQQGGSGAAPNFSVPPPAFQGGPGQGGPGQNYAPPQQGGNWGPPSGGSYQGRQNNRGGSNYGSNPRTDSYGGGERKNNFSGGNSNKSGYNKGDAGGGGSGDMVTQEDTIFVSGMDPQTTEEDIANHFGAIGIIKKDKKTMKPKVWLYRNKETGESKGEATITYDDSNAAQSAISWFDNKKLNGAIIHVSLAQRQNTWQKSGGFRGGNRGGGGGGGRGGPGGPGGNRFDRGSDRGDRDNARDDDRRGGSQGGGGGNRNQREGDWTCSGCNNTNFAWRNECNRCKEPKAGGGGSGNSSGGNSSGGYRGGQDRGGNRPGGQDRGGSFNRNREGPMRGNGDRNDRNRPY